MKTEHFYLNVFALILNGYRISPVNPESKNYSLITESKLSVTKENISFILTSEQIHESNFRGLPAEIPKNYFHA